MEINTEVWVKDRIGNQSWIPARVHSKSSSPDNNSIILVVKTESLEELRFSLSGNGESDDVKLRNQNVEDDEAENLITLPYLHEPAILFCLQVMN